MSARGATEPPARLPRHWFAMGDPQTSFARFAEVLTAHQLLDRDGLRADTGLVVVGDYFDYHEADERNDVGAEGLAILSWLARHPPSQVVLLAGNHDICRVQELVGESDESFAAARQLGERIRRLDEAAPERLALTEAFHERFPRIPTPDIAARDFRSFSVAQRHLVRELLLTGRLELACVAELGPGRPALITHAGVTQRELSQLGMSQGMSPSVVARALHVALRRSLENVRGAWAEGSPVPLDLAPLHVPGTTREEGGGLLYHRPADLARAGTTWETDQARPRRFEPTALPHFRQIVGHTGHTKSRRDLQRWADDAALEQTRGGIRTLSVEGSTIRYRMGAHVSNDGCPALVMIDGEMHSTPTQAYALLPLASVVTPW